MEWVFKDWDIIGQTVVTTLVLFVFIIAITRLVGLRSFAKMNTFDFAVTIAIGSVIANGISSGASIVRSMVGVTALLLLQVIVAWAKRRFSWVGRVADNTPLLLMDGETILEENLTKARVTEADLRAKLREANVIELKEIRAVVLENTGDVSVLHAADQDIELADWLLEGVRRK